MAQVSPYYQYEIKQQFHLSPNHSKNVTEGIEQVMLASLMKYIPSFGGVLICYSNLKILSKTVPLHWEFPDLHIDAQLTVVVFRPEIGQQLSGCVTMRGVDYLSLIVENTWEAHIHFKHATAAMASPAKGAKSPAPVKKNPTITQQPGDKVVFYVKKVMEVDGMLSLEGVLDEALVHDVT